jgi:MoaA/NifB/PqqE/SkfB family radical SAM enzyme
MAAISNTGEPRKSMRALKQLQHLECEHSDYLDSLNRKDHQREITKRFVLYVGFKCNMRCQFCYYLKSIEDGTAKMDKFEDLANKITEARKIGKTEIDFTGGEATIHPDFVQLVEHCKKLGFETINVITNGLTLSRKDFFDKAVAAGLNEVLFSLHSYKAEEHDELTKIPGSYRQILQSIENAHVGGVRVRINSVINKINYADVSNHLAFLKRLKPHSVNLIVFNPTEETVGYKNHENVRIGSYEEIGRYIADALHSHKSDFNVLNVRFLPFCYAKGFETSIRTYWQEIYEKQEWDPMLHWAFRKNWFFVSAAVALGFLLSFFKPSHLKYGKKSLYTRLAEYFQFFRVSYLFVQKKECGNCSLRFICPGLPKELARQHPEAKVHPYSQDEIPTILNPVFFGYEYPAKFPSVAKDLRKANA